MGLQNHETGFFYVDLLISSTCVTLLKLKTYIAPRGQESQGAIMQFPIKNDMYIKFTSILPRNKRTVRYNYNKVALGRFEESDVDTKCDEFVKYYNKEFPIRRISNRRGLHNPCLDVTQCLYPAFKMIKLPVRKSDKTHTYRIRSLQLAIMKAVHTSSIVRSFGMINNVATTYTQNE